MAEPEHVLVNEYLPLSVFRMRSDSASLKSHQDSPDVRIGSRSQAAKRTNVHSYYLLCGLFLKRKQSMDLEEDYPGSATY